MSETQPHTLTDTARAHAAIWQSVYGRGGILHSQTEAAPWPTEPTQRGARDYGPLPARQATSPQRIAFIRQRVRLYAKHLAVMELAGLPFDHSDYSTARAVTMLAATGIAEQCGIPFTDGAAAGRAEHDLAAEQAREFVDQLRRAVYPAARNRAPGATILAAAHNVNDRHGCPMAGDDLTAACRIIAASAQPHTRGRR